ncbi:MAG: GTP-binding protein [Erysipelotrichaceae bacterium]
MQISEIPVYVFTGFLESGKSTFIIENLKNPGFSSGERTLVLICEDGEVQYDDLSDEIKETTDFHYLDSQDKLNCDYLASLYNIYDFERVLIEYNGMWPINDLYQALPDNWVVAQQINLIDSTTFVSYNNMFRNLMVEKITGAEFNLVNRVKYEDDVMVYHKIIRTVSRRSEIAYEYVDGKGIYDDIIDPLPFDINSDVVDIDFKDYAFFISDLVEETDKYFGKKVHFTAQLRSNNRVKSGFVFGREVMTCCIADIRFMGLPLMTDSTSRYEANKWYDIYATIEKERETPFSKITPSLKPYKVIEAEIPQINQQVATFY